MQAQSASDDNATAVVTRASASDPGAESPMPEEGTRLGRYLLIEELGRGGMGVVFRAYDPNLQRAEVRLALASAHWGRGDDPERAREAARLARDDCRDLGPAGADGLRKAEDWLASH